MPVTFYECTECGRENGVRELPATRTDPACSDHGDGCIECGGELSQEPCVGPEPDYEAIHEARMMAREPEGDVW